MAGHDHGSHTEALPEEPKTPMWLPALGAFLFLIAGIWFATRPSAPISAEPQEAPPAPTASATAAQVPGGGTPGGGRPAAPAPRREQPGHEGHGH